MSKGTELKSKQSSIPVKLHITHHVHCRLLHGARANMYIMLGHSTLGIHWETNWTLGVELAWAWYWLLCVSAPFIIYFHCLLQIKLLFMLRHLKPMAPLHGIFCPCGRISRNSCSPHSMVTHIIPPSLHKKRMILPNVYSFIHLQCSQAFWS